MLVGRRLPAPLRRAKIGILRTGESGSAAAEGAIHPETLRQEGPFVH